jgi:hypothetical protein
MADPKVRDMLLAKVDDLTGRMTELVDEVRAVTEQLEPERAPVLPERRHHVFGDGRRDPAAGPRPPARRTGTVRCL